MVWWANLKNNSGSYQNTLQISVYFKLITSLDLHQHAQAEKNVVRWLFMSIIITRTMHVRTFSLVLFLPSYIASTVHWLSCFLFLNAANCRLRSVLNSAKHVCCTGPAMLSYLSSIVKKCCSSLSSIARLGIQYPCVSVHMMHEFLFVITNWHWGALCSQHFKYGSNYGHVFPASRPLVHMRFPVSCPLIRMCDTH